jgi:dTDP-4-amino-4,6-dideoxygalactose transaminase
MGLPFIDLAAQQARIRQDVDQRIAAVLSHGAYILGPEVKELEVALAQRCGAAHVISCSSGTDALILALLGLGLRPGQGVIVPSFTFAASAEAIAVLGSVPVFAEIDPSTYNLEPNGLPSALAAAQAQNIEVVGIMCVGLFGQPADITGISAFADKHGLWVLDDAAQSFGSTWKGQQAGTLGRVTATSFFPAKPLGCYGDGGAVLTNDDSIAEIAVSCRVHGQGRDKYENERIGMTARLDTIQAAILLSKLSIFDDELAARQQVADQYETLLGGKVITPLLAADATSSWAQYVIQLPDGTDRQAVQDRMGSKNIPTAVYYPRPMHTQPPYLRYPVAQDGLRVTERLASSVLALPMHPYLTPEQQEQVADALMSSL